MAGLFNVPTNFLIETVSFMYFGFPQSSTFYGKLIFTTQEKIKR